ncbi:hypothetical protein [Streptomyces sp. NPDC002644]
MSENMQVSKDEAELIRAIRRDGWPLFRALDTALASMPDHNHTPFRPGELDAAQLAKLRSIVHRMMH